MHGLCCRRYCTHPLVNILTIFYEFHRISTLIWYFLIEINFTLEAFIKIKCFSRFCSWFLWNFYPLNEDTIRKKFNLFAEYPRVQWWLQVSHLLQSAAVFLCAIDNYSYLLSTSILSSPATTDCVATAANMKKCILWNWQIIRVKNNGESYCTVGSCSTIQFKDYIWPGVMTCLHDSVPSSKICSVRTISMMMNERWWGTGDDDHGLYQLVSARRSVKVGVVVETVSSSSVCFFWVSCVGSFMQAALTSHIREEFKTLLEQLLLPLTSVSSSSLPIRQRLVTLQCF